jgi:hypothetical protein
MREIKGNLWDYYGKDNFVILVTTNGFVKKNGECVMGRGCALEAKQRIPQLPYLLGYHIKLNGNVPFRVPAEPIMTFPTKHVWWEKSDIELIKKSAEFYAACDAETTFILPRPGCGNGGLKWVDVKPVIETILLDNVWVITYGH